jgi:hypothetical protein
VRPELARWRFAAASLAAVTTAVAGLTLSGPAQQALATTITQARPFPVGNLLNYANSDVESTAFNWAADLSQANDIASIGQDTVSLMHGHSLKIVASGTGTIIYKLGNGQDNTSVAISLPKTGGDYRVGAYMKVPASVSQHTVEFDLGCYNSAGQWLGWVTGTPVSMNANGTWQYVEDDFLAGGPSALPSTCAQVQGSPRVKITGMNANGIVHMDDVIFAPYRSAIAIGAHGQNCEGCTYTAAEWFATDQNIGPLQTDKEFNGDLPASFSGTNCAGDETQLTNNKQDSLAWPVCIIAYTTPVTSQTAMDNFLQGVPAQQEIILVWHQEPEGDSFSNEPGCPGLTGAQAFVCETEQQAGFVHGSRYDTPNVFIAQNSAGAPYLSNPQVDNCSWITPSSATGQGVDLYLVDHYENGTVNGKDVNNSVNATEWQHWLKCASDQNRPLGFGEYGLDNSPIGPASLCTNGPSSPPNAQNLPKALSADNSYLAQLPMSADPNLVNPAPFVVWDYWYSNYGGTPVCTVFGVPTDPYGAIPAWKSIEGQNGGR